MGFCRWCRVDGAVLDDVVSMNDVVLMGLCSWCCVDGVVMMMSCRWCGVDIVLVALFRWSCVG